MVATRNHPKDFEPAPSELAAKQSPSKRSHSGWSHTPSNLTLIWLVFSLPLVIWDTGYVLLRPHSMPGGALHWPIWQPYAYYGTVDGAYGFKAIRENNGWTAAQGWVNLLETVAYCVYLYLVYAYGQQEATQGRGAPEQDALGSLKALAESRTVYGREASWAVLLGYSTGLVTFSKTVLYWMIEAFTGFDNIGHNDWFTLIVLWGIMNGLWIGFPLYMMYVFGQEILQGLESATEGGKKVR
ncbi:hypothetical protein BAUCODRAFT_61862 [Baudoinia panamericana UAMH 10762]|uniref:EXPERA domain-containing protein n=1 Tax=Baudoinia panamericana (strain UAMH 10762) TaxID=717646 RepID=M2NMK6_BAUPA|nr:uncharacterized protein BAUCODRAFT_61862 [Baudoinia panamericana UAMH 10762]EMD00760.1 hypothetical protein BAUCODRAFT_61862 [Baudoinia panamericana UAMH 10762]